MTNTTDANDIVDPKNTEKLYGDEAEEKEARPGDEETTPTSEPDNDGLAKANLYPDSE